MTVTPPPEPLFAWLPPEQVLRWLKLTDADEHAAVAEDCRRAAAAWCETQRPDLIVLDPETLLGTFTASPAVVQAGVLATARIYARQGSPAGLVSYAELGAGEILRIDPDVTRLLGVGRYAPPAVG